MNLDSSLPSRYRPVRVLGQGAFGTVVEAIDQNFDRDVAIKILSPMLAENDATIRFLKVGRLLARLRIPHVLEVLDLGRLEEGTPFLVFPILRGGTLEEAWERQEVSLERVRELGSKLGKALAELHQEGILHRDIKPENILFDAKGSPFLTDFGLAHDEADQDSLTRTGCVAGTPLYSPPERLQLKPASPAADQWSLAATLALVWTGVHPYGDLSRPLFQRALFGPPQFDLPVSAEIRELRAWQVLERALWKDPAERFPSMEAFTKAWEKAWDSKGKPRLRSPEVFGSNASKSLEPTPPRRSGQFLLLAVGLLGLGLGAYGPPQGKLPSPPPEPKPSFRPKVPLEDQRFREQIEAVRGILVQVHGTRVEIPVGISTPSLEHLLKGLRDESFLRVHREFFEGFAAYAKRSPGKLDAPQCLEALRVCLALDFLLSYPAWISETNRTRGFELLTPAGGSSRETEFQNRIAEAWTEMAEPIHEVRDRFRKEIQASSLDEEAKVLLGMAGKLHPRQDEVPLMIDFLEAAGPESALAWLHLAHARASQLGGPIEFPFLLRLRFLEAIPELRPKILERHPEAELYLNFATLRLTLQIVKGCTKAPCIPPATRGAILEDFRSMKDRGLPDFAPFARTVLSNALHRKSLISMGLPDEVRIPLEELEAELSASPPPKDG